MWMSLMTSGVKMRDRPRIVFSPGAVSSGRAVLIRGIRCLLEDDPSLGRLEVVVVVERLAADELVEVRRRAEAVEPELAPDQLGVAVGPLARHAVHAERLDLAGHVDRAVVHGVAETRARVAADDHAAALHHEAGVRPHGAADDDRAALLVDARAGADAAADDEVAAAHGGPG